MAQQYSVAVRDARNDVIETTIGTAALLRVRTGAPPANCAAADTGTVLATMSLPTDYMSASASGVKTLLGTWQDASADANGTAAHYRLYNTAGTTCHMQGTCGQAFGLTTNAITAANGNVLNFASTTGVAVGQTVSGTGIVAGTTVVALNATTVTLSHTSTAGVANGATITFGYDLNVDNASIVAGQQVTVTTFTITDGNA